MDRPNQTLLAVLFIAALVVGSLSGVGLVLAVVGLAQQQRWWERWGVWLPSIFGVSVVVGVITFVLLLLSGID